MILNIYALTIVVTVATEHNNDCLHYFFSSYVKITFYFMPLF